MTFQLDTQRNEALQTLKAARVALELARIDIVRAWMTLVDDNDREAFWNLCVSVDPTCRDIFDDECGERREDWYAVCDIGQPDGNLGMVHAIFRNGTDATAYQSEMVGTVVKPFRFQGVMRVE